MPADATEAITAIIADALDDPPPGTGDADRPAGAAQRWTARLGGLCLTFAVDDRELAAALASLFPAADPVAGADAMDIRLSRGPDGMILHIDGREVLRNDAAAIAIGAVSQAILTRLHPGRHLLATVHASAAARADAGFVFAAPSGSGKSTLVAYLARSGFDYLGDDLTAVTREGEILPWPAAMSIKQGSWRVLQPLYPELAAIGDARIGPKTVRHLPPRATIAAPVPLKAFLFPRYMAGAPTSLTAVPPLDALARLVNDRIWIGYPLREEAIDALLDLLARTPCHALDYGDLADAAERLRAIAGAGGRLAAAGTMG
jgi:hypothetical protein